MCLGLKCTPMVRLKKKISVKKGNDFLWLWKVLMKFICLVFFNCPIVNILNNIVIVSMGIDVN